MRNRARNWFGTVGSLFLLAISLLLAGGSQEATTVAAGATPRTLVTTPGRIYAFAQDGDRIGWIAADARVRVRRLTTRRTWVVGKVDYRERASSAVMALAGQRALWASDSGGNSDETSIVTGAPGRRPALVDVLSGDLRGTGGGVRFGGVAGNGAMLAYGWVVEQCVNRPFGCDSPFTDPLVVTGGGVTLVPAEVTGQGPPAIAGVAPPAMFAVGQGRVAVVPAKSPTPAGEWVPRVAQDGPVEVYDLGGNLLMRAIRQGIVRDVELFGDNLAVLLEQPDESKLILRFDAQNGTYLSQSGQLPIGARDLSTGTAGNVFRIGREIYLVHGRTQRLVARSAGTPIGLSIEGRRIAWGVNLKGRGRIVALTLPG